MVRCLVAVGVSPSLCVLSISPVPTQRVYWHITILQCPKTVESSSPPSFIQSTLLAALASSSRHNLPNSCPILSFQMQCPKTVENFTTHAKNGYYDGIIFHR